MEQEKKPTRQKRAVSQKKSTASGDKSVHIVRSPELAAEKKRPVAVRRVVEDARLLEEHRDPVRKPFPYATILAILLIVGVAMYVLSLRITLDNLTADISIMEAEIAQNREEQNALEVRLNAKYDLTEIERIAKEEYGMVNKDTLTKRYVSVSGGDLIEKIDPKQDKSETE